MNQGMVNTVISAIVGGVVGAGVVFFAGGKTELDLKNVEMENLKVAKLTITQGAALIGKDEKPVVAFLPEGTIVVENVVLAKKFVGQQIQGHAIVANRLFATPDDLMKTPMNQWRFFAEIGASAEAGGEIVVRNHAGAAMVDRPTAGGKLIRAGFDTEAKPQIIAIDHLARTATPISSDLSDAQRRLINNPQGTTPGAFDGAASQNPPSVALPGAGTNPVL